MRTLPDLYRSCGYAVKERSVVDGFVGLPAELLGGLTVDEYIIYKMEWLFVDGMSPDRNVEILALRNATHAIDYQPIGKSLGLVC